MEERLYGYIRVSTQEQHADRQRIAMEEFGISQDRIFLDHQSGKDFKRPAYQRLLKQLRPNDVLVVKSIDRLGRNYAEILEQWRIITKEKKASIVVLEMPLLDTRREKDLIGTLLADVVLQLLSYVAETERKFIRQRQVEGIAAAKRRGVRFGRIPIQKPDNYPEILALWKQHEISARKAAKILGISHYTFLRWVQE